MKPILFIIAFVTIASIQPIFAQDTTMAPVQKALVSYLNIKNSLAKDRPDSARFYAQVFVTALQTADPEQPKIAAAAKGMMATTDLKKQRKQFALVSSAFYEWLKVQHANTVEVYYQYCPMAEAYWISETSKIQNPYFGKQMLFCGSTKETLQVQNR